MFPFDWWARGFFCSQLGVLPSGEPWLCADLEWVSEKEANSLLLVYLVYELTRVHAHALPWGTLTPLTAEPSFISLVLFRALSMGGGEGVLEVR